MTLDEILKSNKMNGVESSVLKSALAEVEREQAEKLGRTLQLIFKCSGEMLSSNLISLRQKRKEADAAEKRLKAISRAVAYFKVSGNPLPYFKLTDTYQGIGFLRGLGLDASDYPSEKDDTHEVWKVPSDFVEPTTA